MENKSIKQTKPTAHIVSDGDSLKSIAEKYNIKLDKLIKLNEDNLYVRLYKTVKTGQTIKLK